MNILIWREGGGGGILTRPGGGKWVSLRGGGGPSIECKSGTFKGRCRSVVVAKDDFLGLQCITSASQLYTRILYALTECTAVLEGLNIILFTTVQWGTNLCSTKIESTRTHFRKIMHSTCEVELVLF